MTEILKMLNVRFDPSLFLNYRSEMAGENHLYSYQKTNLYDNIYL